VATTHQHSLPEPAIGGRNSAGRPGPGRRALRSRQASRTTRRPTRSDDHRGSRIKELDPQVLTIALAPRGTRTTHGSPDTDTVTNSATQLGIIFGFTVVVMLLVLWRRR
jgi:hypothetical protein